METSLFLAKLIGLYAVIMGLLWLVSGSSIRKNIEACMEQPLFLVLSGFLALIAGLAIAIGHNVWVADWRLAITLIGYLSLLKGVVLLGWPKSLMMVSRPFLHAKGAVIYIVIIIPLGAWLAWIGFAG